MVLGLRKIPIVPSLLARRSSRFSSLDDASASPRSEKTTISSTPDNPGVDEVLRKPSHTSVVSAEHVTVKLGKGFVALDDVNVELAAGRITGLIGPSGAGKTTLIRSIVGRQAIAAGQLVVLGQTAGMAGLRSQLSYMTQEQSTYADLTARQNVIYFARMIGLGRKAAQTAAAEALATVGMTDKADILVSNLSGGQKQRVSLAIALLGQSKLLVLDEPTVGLDPVLREDLWRLFHKLSEQGTSIIISSHVMDEAERCDDLLLIRGGKLLAHSTPQQLRDSTGASSVEQAFLKLVGETK